MTILLHDAVVVPMSMEEVERTDNIFNKEGQAAPKRTISSSSVTMFFSPHLPLTVKLIIIQIYPIGTCTT